MKNFFTLSAVIALSVLAGCGPKDGQYTFHLLTTYADSVRNAAGKGNVILVDAGDCLQGDNAAYYFNYVDTVSRHVYARMADYMRYDAVVVGNHDIETGHPVYDRIVRQMKTPFLAANAISETDGSPYFRDYVILRRHGVKIAVLGLAFKGGTDDCRESPAMDILRELIKCSHNVSVYDPKAMDNAKKIFGNKITYAKDEYEAAKGADVLVILTEWNRFKKLDLEKLGKLMQHKRIVDLRNAVANRYVKRMWTSPQFNNVCPEDERLAVWHLPYEKKRGLYRLFRLLEKQGGLGDEERFWHRAKELTGVPAVSLRKRLRDRWTTLIGKFKELKGVISRS